MRVPAEFAFSHERIVQPNVNMGPDGFPERYWYDTTPRPFDRCRGFGDVLGVLNRWKPVSMIALSTAERGLDRPGGKARPDCSLRPVADWDAWKRRLVEACDAAGIVYMRASEGRAYLFHRDDARHAALLYLIHDSTNPELETGRHGVFLVGRLLGYALKDIEAWYLNHGLLHSLFFRDLSDGLGAERNAAMRIEYRDLFHRSFLRFAKRGDALLRRLLRSEAVTRAEAFVQRGMRSLSAPAPKSKQPPESKARKS